MKNEMTKVQPKVAKIKSAKQKIQNTQKFNEKHTPKCQMKSIKKKVILTCKV